MIDDTERMLRLCLTADQQNMLDRLLRREREMSRAEGYAEAKEQAQAIAEVSRVEANAFIAAGCTDQEMVELEREAAAAEEIRDEIRAMEPKR